MIVHYLIVGGCFSSPLFCTSSQRMSSRFFSSGLIYKSPANPPSKDRRLLVPSLPTAHLWQSPVSTRRLLVLAGGRSCFTRQTIHLPGIHLAVSTSATGQTMCHVNDVLPATRMLLNTSRIDQSDMATVRTGHLQHMPVTRVFTRMVCLAPRFTGMRSYRVVPITHSEYIHVGFSPMPT